MDSRNSRKSEKIYALEFADEGDRIRLLLVLDDDAQQRVKEATPEIEDAQGWGKYLVMEDRGARLTDAEEGGVMFPALMRMDENGCIMDAQSYNDGTFVRALPLEDIARLNWQRGHTADLSSSLTVLRTAARAGGDAPAQKKKTAETGSITKTLGTGIALTGIAGALVLAFALNSCENTVDGPVSFLPRSGVTPSATTVPLPAPQAKKPPSEAPLTIILPDKMAETKPLTVQKSGDNAGPAPAVTAGEATKVSASTPATPTGTAEQKPAEKSEGKLEQKPASPAATAAAPKSSVAQGGGSKGKPENLQARDVYYAVAHGKETDLVRIRLVLDEGAQRRAADAARKIRDAKGEDRVYLLGRLGARTIEDETVDMKSCDAGILTRHRKGKATLAAVFEDGNCRRKSFAQHLGGTIRDTRYGPDGAVKDVTVAQADGTAKTYDSRGREILFQLQSRGGSGAVMVSKSP